MNRHRASDAFRGPLAHEFKAFVAYRQALATCHEHVLVTLHHLDRFLVAHAPTATGLTGALLDQWMTTLAAPAPATRRNYFRLVRQFCVFRARADPTGFVPDPIQCPRVRTRFRPYIYSEGEIRALLQAAAGLSGTLRPHTYVMLLLLLYTTGLRIGEALRLRLTDLDHDRAVLHIGAGKFRKSRLVPISASCLSRFDRYLDQRRRAAAPTCPDAALFWSPRGGHYSLIGIQRGISDLLRAVCGKRPGRGTGPRVHDMRHYPERRIIPRR